MTPQQTIQQLVDPPQTNIKSSSYSIAGVDPSQPGIGARHAVARLERPLPRTGGERGARRRHLRGRQEPEARLEARPERHEVHGRRPRQAAARRPDRRRLHPAREAAEARRPAGPRERRARARERAARRSPRCRRRSSRSIPNAQVASSKQVADQISGSLVDASNLSHRLGVALAIARRARRVPARRAADALLGRQARARARDAEGARLDAAAGRAPGRRRVARAGRRRRPARRSCSASLIAAAIGAFGPTLTATSSTGGDARRLRARRARRAHGHRPGRAHGADRDHRAPARLRLALAGGLLAGAAGAFRAARLRPADALRTVE